MILRCSRKKEQYMKYGMIFLRCWVLCVLLIERQLFHKKGKSITSPRKWEVGKNRERNSLPVKRFPI